MIEGANEVLQAALLFGRTTQCGVRFIVLCGPLPSSFNDALIALSQHLAALGKDVGRSATFFALAASWQRGLWKIGPIRRHELDVRVPWADAWTSARL